ncbi:MAG: orotidine-5'-phosphate decarboxylase [Sulfolobales archaeon]|nr:orotidine-5'-phosphate decarboxylase [Sulfolobales archaeon]MCX8199347.1 orotidine-5'-phosphate decarboxylase [Sulfolobales archaeon]MDW8170339.1 orotidine-5'-phosphate decarboxylase [Desulfurococcaceae archaeon]
MLIVALDPLQKEDVINWSKEVVYGVRNLVTGFKIGMPLLIKVGISGCKKIFCDYSGLLIADLKLADIGDIMASVVRDLSEAGVNTVIAHAFVGRSGALDKLVGECEKLDVKVVLVVSMSHRGSEEFIDKHLSDFMELALSLNVWGVVAPATRLSVVRRVRELGGSRIKVLSPGIGAQGAQPGTAICAGADYEIVGRAITASSNPTAEALKVLSEQGRKVKECLGSH